MINKGCPAWAWEGTHGKGLYTAGLLWFVAGIGPKNTHVDMGTLFIGWSYQKTGSQ